MRLAVLSVYSGNIQKRNDEGDSRRDLSQPLSDFKGVCQENQLTEIRATGGFAQSPIFRQMMADVLGYPLVFPTVTEASALGAVILGWRSIGKIQSISEAQELIELKEQVGVQETDHKNIRKSIHYLFRHKSI